MERKQYYAQPKIVSKIVELQLKHSLPVNIIVGECFNGLRAVTFEYEPNDHHLMAWLVNKGTEYYTCLPAEEIMEDDD